jgi:hypothetical protein
VWWNCDESGSFCDTVVESIIYYIYTKVITFFGVLFFPFFQFFLVYIVISPKPGKTLEKPGKTKKISRTLKSFNYFL